MRGRLLLMQSLVSALQLLQLRRILLLLFLPPLLPVPHLRVRNAPFPSYLLLRTRVARPSPKSLPHIFLRTLRYAAPNFQLHPLRCVLWQLMQVLLLAARWAALCLRLPRQPTLHPLLLDFNPPPPSPQYTFASHLKWMLGRFHCHPCLLNACPSHCPRQPCFLSTNSHNHAPALPVTPHKQSFAWLR